MIDLAGKALPSIRRNHTVLQGPFRLNASRRIASIADHESARTPDAIAEVFVLGGVGAVSYRRESWLGAVAGDEGEALPTEEALAVDWAQNAAGLARFSAFFALEAVGELAEEALSIWLVAQALVDLCFGENAVSVGREVGFDAGRAAFFARRDAELGAKGAAEESEKDQGQFHYKEKLENTKLKFSV